MPLSLLLTSHALQQRISEYGLTLLVRLPWKCRIVDTCVYYAEREARHSVNVRTAKRARVASAD